MKVFSRWVVCNLIVLSLIALPYSAQTQAALIGTEQAVARVQAHSERDKVRSFLARTEVQSQLAAFGLSSSAAGERVNALSDEEVSELAGRIDSLPAGADLGIVTALLIVALVLILFMFLDSRK
jgi:hypothetical protein